MSTPEPGFVCPVGPALEWLEPKLPDILKNGGTLPSITKDDGKTVGTVLEPLEMDSCDIAGVRFALSTFLLTVMFCHSCCYQSIILQMGLNDSLANKSDLE